jgi:hypothetical protein
MKATVLVLAALFTTVVARATLILTERHEGGTVIVVDSAATEAEKHAAQELVATLYEMTRANFTFQTGAEKVPSHAILVGAGEAARRFFPEVPFDRLEPEEIVIKTKGNRLLLAGGRPRGTLYAVSRFLQDYGGVRWWTPWARHVPHHVTLSVTNLNVRAKPAFEYREPYWFSAFDRDWAVHNCVNGQSGHIPSAMGGSVAYKGFVHTFYSLVPPAKYFSEHPEWFSLIRGQRTADRAQLCLTNPKLREFVTEQVRQWLRASPEASIVSVSQNDWQGACECADCRALDEAEGSHAGSLLAFVNAIAEKIEPEFPRVKIDTLAYQYTRRPPQTLRPRWNVVVRLCSIECNFREPLDHPSNAAFARDLEGWAKICRRLYVWDYTTDFAHYVQPHPNWFTLGPNLRYLQQRGVRGVFEQGAYQSYGSEMAELRAWVLAQLLWNPQQDDRALINEFLDGYYGEAAAPYIRRYLELMHDASRGYSLTCYSGTDAPFLQFKYLAQAEELWQHAEHVAQGPELARVRLSHLPLRYVWLSRWDALQQEARASGDKWPIALSSKAVAGEWAAAARVLPCAAWTRTTLLNEAGLTTEKFLARFAQEKGELH